MKTKIALTAIAMSIASFSVSADIKNPAADQAGKKIFTAFQHAAFMEYNALIPSLEQLNHVMDAHAKFYGAYLSDAKAELAKQYAGDVKRIENSFINAIDKNTISWSKAQFVSASRENETLAIEFTVEGKTHKIKIAVTEIDGELRAGQVIACL